MLSGDKWKQMPYGGHMYRAVLYQGFLLFFGQ